MSAPAATTNDVAELARAALRGLEPLHRSTQAPRSVILRSQGDDAEVTVTLPPQALKFLVEVLGHLATGSHVAIVSRHAELTTQQAAEFLNVSRPHVVRLLDDGTIPHRKVGTHRRVKMADLLEYRQRESAAARAALDELVWRQLILPADDDYSCRCGSCALWHGDHVLG